MKVTKVGDATVATLSVGGCAAVGIAVRSKGDEEREWLGREVASYRAALAVRAAGDGKGRIVFVVAPRPRGSAERSALIRALARVTGEELLGGARDSLVVSTRTIPRVLLSEIEAAHGVAATRRVTFHRCAVKVNGKRIGALREVVIELKGGNDGR